MVDASPRLPSSPFSISISAGLKGAGAGFAAGFVDDFDDFEDTDAEELDVVVGFFSSTLLTAELSSSPLLLLLKLRVVLGLTVLGLGEVDVGVGEAAVRGELVAD